MLPTYTSATGGARTTRVGSVLPTTMPMLFRRVSIPQAAGSRRDRKRSTIGPTLVAVRLLLLLLLSPTAPVAAQLAAQEPGASASAFVAQGDRETAGRRTANALAAYERALAADPRSYEALWKAARDAVDLGEFEPNTATRTALYARASEYAQRAVTVTPSDAEGHFQLARAIGRTAMNKSARERVKYAADVRVHALTALEIAPAHSGSLHVMGVWHAEVMRLNGFQRAVAKAFLGGEILGTASWAEAIRLMENSVRIEPHRLVHHLDLARVYRDSGREADARRSYETALRTAFTDANDYRYRQNAERELTQLK